MSEDAGLKRPEREQTRSVGWSDLLERTVPPAAVVTGVGEPLRRIRKPGKEILTHNPLARDDDSGHEHDPDHSGEDGFAHAAYSNEPDGPREIPFRGGATVRGVGDSSGGCACRPRSGFDFVRAGVSGSGAVPVGRAQG